MSDLRLKKNITALEPSLEKILRLRSVRYDYKTEPEAPAGHGKNIGVIAQELEREFPELVSTDQNTYKGVSYAMLSPILLKAIQELKAQKDSEINSLLQKNAQLQTQVDEMRREIDEIKQLLSQSVVSGGDKK